MTAPLAMFEKFLGEKAILTGEDISDRYTKSWGGRERIRPLAVVRPASVHDVSTVLRLCHDTGTAVVPQGGMTGLVKGGVPEAEGIVLSLERLNQIEEIDKAGRTMTVQAGVPLQTAHEAAEEHNLFMPVDLGARGSATIGGMISTNAGGIRVVRYGMMRESVLGLEAVMADGKVVTSLNRMLKNNAGYDLKQLFIGSEGTLGVVTRAVLRLRANPSSYTAAFVAVDGFENLVNFLGQFDTALGGGLGAFEVMWQDYVQFVVGGNDGHRCPLPMDHQYYVLTEGLDVPDDVFQGALAEALEQGLVADAAIAQSEADRQDFWKIREEIGEALRTLGRVFTYDVSMPIKSMDTFDQQLKSGMDARYPGHKTMLLGHMADGNLHAMVSAGEGTDADHKAVDDLMYGIIRDLGGSVSAEHGIGLEKKDYLSWCRAPEELALMKTLKGALDPKGILNPGKVF